MKKIILSLFLLSLGIAPIMSQELKHISFFFLEICPSCNDYKLAYSYADIVTALDKDPQIEGHFYNMIDQKSRTILKETLSKNGLPDVSRSLPLLVINDQFYNGYDEIGIKLKTLESKQP